MSETSHRLPDVVRPERYELTLEPDLDAATFRGEVLIDVVVDAPTDCIVLHALDLAIEVATVDGAGASVHLDAEQETATMQLADPVAPGPARIQLTFTGVLNDQLVGFYRSTFRADGDADEGMASERTLAVTQFESTHARRAFPCFDEPAMKAVFSITLVVPEDLLVVANTAELAREAVGDGRVRVHFADTIAMSTYLVAFVIGPLEATDARVVAGIDGPIPLRVVHPPGKGHLCEFALDVAEAALEFFERYYGLPYPGDKVDLVAVPDFAFGAMENLGCITFREVLLLVDPATATQPELQRVADVINHELAHMWFGDLVTMDWWNGIWLNEAFATFMEVKASESFRPDWDVWTTFGLARAAAFDTDTLHSTRPIEYEVVTAADAEGMFDILTYEKGASVVRMLEQYVGEEPFRAGIAEYLRRHAYSTTATTDLWDALEEVTGEPVRRIMDSWIFRGGHPVVQVRRDSSGVELDQRRASYDRERGEERWPIPMVLAIGTDDGTSAGHRLLLEDATSVDTDLAPTYVQANVGGAGFYRVELDAELRTGLLDHAGPGALERFVLLDDTWVGVVAGRVALAEGVELIERLAATEEDPSVWRRLAGSARELSRLAGPTHRDHVAPWIARLAVPALARVEALLTAPGGDTERMREVRGVTFVLAGADGEDPVVRARARDLLEDRSVDASLRAAAIAVVASGADAVDHEHLERHWREAATPQEELRYLNALVDTDDEALFRHTLDLAATEVRTQNAPYLLRRAIDHPRLGAVAWEFVADRWDELSERFPSNSLPRMLEGIRGIADEHAARSVDGFLSARPLTAGERQVTQHVERMWVTVHAARRVREELDRSVGMLGHAAS